MIRTTSWLGSWLGKRLGLGLACLFLFCPTAAQGDDVPKLPAPRTFTLPDRAMAPEDLAKSLTKQTGIDVDFSRITGDLGGFPRQSHDFWAGLSLLAEKSGSQIAIGGPKIELRPLSKPVPTSISTSIRGPFLVRIVGVRASTDFLSGKSTYELTLEVAWEPWLQVFRGDGSATITSATDDRKTSLTVPSQAARGPVSGMATQVRLYPQGLTRAAKSIATLNGNLTLTLAEEMLSFRMPADDVGKSGDQKGVDVRLLKSKADGKDWQVEIATAYPKGGPLWESHEGYWTSRNDCRLIDPEGKAHRSEDGQDGNSPNAIVYQFRNLAGKVGPGWTIEYRTPGPMREVKVPFQLKDIPLP
jgi:hypothetical protein